MITNYLLVGLGGGIGALLRYGMGQWKFSSNFPFTTFIVNILGCFLMGICIALLRQSKLESSSFLFFGTGICGGFTTFSTFSAENLTLLQNDKIALFFLYAISSVFLSLLATLLGFKLFS